MAAPDDPWIRNPGHRLTCAEGRRVYVRLRNGHQPPESWLANDARGQPGARWTLTDDPWDIVAFRLAR